MSILTRNVSAAKKAAEAAQRQADEARLVAEQEAAAAKVAVEAAAQVEKEARANFKRRSQELEREVVALEAAAADVLGRPAPTERPLHEIRVHARLFLAEGTDLKNLKLKTDPIAGPTHDLGFKASMLLQTVEADLDPSHDLASRCDAAEVALWSGFVRRVRQLSGESS